MAQQSATCSSGQWQKATVEQWFWVADIADRNSEPKGNSVDGFTGFWASVFCFFSALGIWMLTGIRRSEKARGWLVVLLGAFAVLEYGLQLLADVQSEPGGMPDARFISQFLHEGAWIMRHIFAVFPSVGVLAYFFYSYEDQILSIRLEIGEMMKELQDLRGIIATRGATRKIVSGATGPAEACFWMILTLANFPGAEALETSNCAGLTAAVVVLAVFLCGAVLALAVLINNWWKLKDEVRRLKSADAGLIPNPIFSGTLSSTAEENEILRNVPDDELPPAVSVPPEAPADLAAPLMPNTSQQARRGRRQGSRLPKRRGRNVGRLFHRRREGRFGGSQEDLGVDFQKFEPS